MTTFLIFRKRLTEEFSSLCEAFYLAESWLEEDGLSFEARSGFDSLKRKDGVPFEKFKSPEALKS